MQRSCSFNCLLGPKLHSIHTPSGKLLCIHRRNRNSHALVEIYFFVKYSVSVRRFVMNLLQKPCHRKANKNMSLNNIVNFTGISRNTIKRWKSKGICDKPPKRTAPTLKDIASPLIVEMMTSSCVWTYASICQNLKAQGVTCCKRSLFTILKYLHISRKRIQSCQAKMKHRFFRS